MKKTKTYKFTPALEHPKVKHSTYVKSYGHGAYGEPDYNIGDKYSIKIKEKWVDVNVFDYIVTDELDNVIGVIHEFSLPDSIRIDLDDEYKEKMYNERKELYYKLKDEFEKN